MKDILRRCRFRPFRKGMGPTFGLTVWYTNRTDWRGQSRLGYELTMRNEGKRRVLFTGEDFSPSICHSIDGDECIAGLMGFLTLRPGDTDEEYFDGYTAEQLEYCSLWAESLGCEVDHRFGER